MENVGSHDSVVDNGVRHRQATPSDEMRSISPDTPPSASRWKAPSPIVPAHYPSGPKRDVAPLSNPKHMSASQAVHPHHPTSNSPHENATENTSPLLPASDNRKSDSDSETHPQNHVTKSLIMGPSLSMKGMPIHTAKGTNDDQAMSVKDMSSSDLGHQDGNKPIHNDSQDALEDISGRQSVAKEARRYQSLQDVASTIASAASREAQSSSDPPRTPQTGAKLRAWHKRGVRNKADKDLDGPKMDKQTKQFFEAQLLRSKTEIPYPLQMSIYEEVYPIVLRSVETYTAELGHDHQVTVAAIQRLQDLARLLRRKSEY
eukprot:TRINITY_DN3488_c0_g1_i7.p1 TRINITY_DN3488_c0_g1~~TRINITY_DN3488_c0_g1_i7.p1  ORF type:complete len:317 (+),score=66.80 TRINITY_DN3488_c0_g1_i7:93-1043(+)